MPYKERQQRLDYQKKYRLIKGKEKIENAKKLIKSGTVKENNFVLVMGESWKIKPKN
tara:strand:+ start:339 stop:509 length:171 start_codon:yes stop_codon:yes gene_type:complete